MCVQEDFACCFCFSTCARRRALQRNDYGLPDASQNEKNKKDNADSDNDERDRDA